MIRAILLLALAALATPSSAQELRLKAQETLVLEVAGLTAAYVVDGSIAEVALVNGKVHIRGLRAGTTTLSVIVLPQEISLFDIVVSASAKASARSKGPAAAAAAADVVDTSYNSDTGRVTSSVSSTRTSRGSMTRVAATSATYLGKPSADARVSLPAVTVEIVRGTHQVTLLDQQVGPTPLQRSARNVRGAHYRSDRLELHAGLLSSTLYRNFIFSPAFSSKVATASYQFRAGGLTLAPRASWNSSDTTGYGVSGFAPTLQLRPTRQAGPFQFNGEIGYSHGAAAAARVSFDNARHHFAVTGEHLPPTFPTPGGGPPSGSSFRGEVANRIAPRLSFNANVEGARRQYANVSQRTGASIAEVRAVLSPRWSVMTGSTVSLFDDDLVKVISISVPVELSWKASRSSVSALGRYQQSTNRNRGGMGGRVRGDARAAGVTFSGSVDFQREAATVDLVFREIPELERIFAELGFSVTTPEELSRLIQGNTLPELAEFLERSTVELSPWRLNSRVEASWTSRSRADLFQVRVLSDRSASTGLMRDQFLTTLAYTRRIGRSVDLTGSSTRFLTGSAGARTARWSYSVGMRARFAGVDALGSIFRRQVIRGRVFRDDAGEGTSALAPSPMAGVRVLLDDGQTAVTDADGGFEFDNVRRGAHRVSASLPSSAGFRFTTPYEVSVTNGQPISFGIGRLPARLIGYVRDDAGAPIRGVKIVLVCGAQHFDATTDTSGRYTITGPEAPCSVMPEASSLPAGYAAGDVEPRTVNLAPSISAHADYVFRAMRSLTGVVAAAAAGRAVTLRHDSGDSVKRADAAGRFAFRNLGPGAYTVSVDTGTKVVERRVELPSGPGLIDVDMRQDK